MHSTPINIGRQPQLFFDNHVIEFIQALTRRMHRPKKHPQNPLIVQDQPWEKSTYIRTGNACVAYDPVEALTKCWYADYAWDYERFMGRSQAHQGEDEHIAPGWFDTTDCRWLYAESEDGVHFSKPPLDYRDFQGQKTNICLGREDYGQVYVASVFLDPFETDQARRFKFLHWRQTTGDIGKGSEIRMACSADGRAWNVDESVITFGDIGSERVIGDEFMVLPDPVRGQYILNVRQRAMAERLEHMEVPCRLPKNWEPPYYIDDPLLITKRRVFMTNSNDLMSWPTLREMMVPSDTDDTIDDEFYSMPSIRIGDVYIGFLNVLHGTDNTMSVRLVYSRDAFHWNHVDRGAPFLDVDETPGSWEPYMVEVGNTVVQRDDRIDIYYGASACHHDWWMYGELEGLDMPDEPGVCKTGLGLATLRPEGFVSIDSTVRPGLLLTRPFISDGSRLVVNVQCEPKGWFEVELTDADDRVVAGYERSACDRFTGDHAHHAVTWGGKSLLPPRVLAQGAKLRFFSQRASLYSFRIAE